MVFKSLKILLRNDIFNISSRSFGHIRGIRPLGFWWQLVLMDIGQHCLAPREVSERYLLCTSEVEAGDAVARPADSGGWTRWLVRLIVVMVMVRIVSTLLSNDT
jgi:hypothetical protein